MSTVWYEARATCRATLRTEYACEYCGKRSIHSVPLSRTEGRRETDILGSGSFVMGQRAAESAKRAARDALLEDVKKRQDSNDYGHSKCTECSYVQSWMLKAAHTERNGGILMKTWGVLALLLVVAELLFHPAGLRYSTHGAGYVGYLVIGLPLAALVSAAILASVFAKVFPFDPNKHLEACTVTNRPTVVLCFPDGGRDVLLATGATDHTPPKGQIAQWAIITGADALNLASEARIARPGTYSAIAAEWKGPGSPPTLLRFGGTIRCGCCGASTAYALDGMSHHVPCTGCKTVYDVSCYDATARTTHNKLIVASVFSHVIDTNVPLPEIALNDIAEIA